MITYTADISDEMGDEARIADPGFTDYGGRAAFCGSISTVKCHEDNSLVREALEEAGHGRVLVVDGGGSMRCALLGDQLAALGAENGWAGVIVYGCIRDSSVLATTNFGVRALATHPRKSLKRGEGQRDVRVSFSGITFCPGELLYTDSDGIVVMTEPAKDIP